MLFSESDYEISESEISILEKNKKNLLYDVDIESRISDLLVGEESEKALFSIGGIYNDGEIKI